MLTLEQQKLVEQYHGFIFSFSKEMHLNFAEWYDILAIALCKAAAFYDPDQGRVFMTTAYQYMRYAVFNEWRKKKLARSIPEDDIVSYNVIVKGPHGNPTEKLELLESKLSNPKMDYTAIEVEEFRNTLSGLPLHVFDALMDGHNGAMVGRELHLSKQRIHQIKKELQNRWLTYSAA